MCIYTSHIYMLKKNKKPKIKSVESNIFICHNYFGCFSQYSTVRLGKALRN